MALGVQASFLENDEEEGDGFFTFVQYANEDKSKDSSPSVRHSRCLLTSSLLRFCGFVEIVFICVLCLKILTFHNRNRLQSFQQTIVKNLAGYLTDSNVPVCISALKVCFVLFWVLF